MKEINRRSFAALLAAGAGGALLAAGQSAAASATPAPAPAPATGHGHARKRLVKPARLRAGDLVGLIAPSGHVSDAQIENCVANLTALGVRVKIGKYIREVRGNYAGSVEHRLEDLHAMFADKEVKAIFTAHGGSGAISLLPYIDYALVRKNPKILIGYSDITPLLLALQSQTGLVTFHGPVAASIWTDYSMAHVRATLMEGAPRQVIEMADENRKKAEEFAHFGIRTVHEGVAEGRLVGGNLSMVSALAGSKYAADFRHGLVFLEDIGEAPYKIDRMLTQLELSQGFAKSAGMMFGIWDKCGPIDNEPSLTLAETIDDHLLPLKMPAVYGYSFGHIRHQFTLPLGVTARLDTQAQTLTLLEAAVV